MSKLQLAQNKYTNKQMFFSINEFYGWIWDILIYGFEMIKYKMLFELKSQISLLE